MFLIVGLGNPKDEHKNTRHNIGRDFVFYFAKKNNFPEFKPDKKFKALTSQKKIEDKDVLLLLPETFMNLSGDAVLSAARYFKIKPENIFVVHDEIDLPFGRAKITLGRGSGGHKGIEDIINKIKTKNFFRVRIGIHPSSEKKIKAEDIVLEKFSDEEKKELKNIKETINQALLCAILEGPQKAMQMLN